MQYADLKCLWGEDLSALNGEALGRVYAERAADVLVGRELDPSLYWGWGKIDIDRVMELVGCQRSAIYGNAVIRALIDALEVSDAAKEPREGSVSGENVIRFPSERARFPSRYKNGRIVVASVALNTEKGRRLYRIPTLFWEEGIDREISDWMRCLAKEEVPLSTMLEYCKIARAFLRFCREQNIAPDAVNDDVLRSYRAMKLNCKVKVARINTLMGTIFQHYMWAEREGRIKDRVQRYELYQYSAEMQSHPFAFRSHEFRKKNGITIRVTDTKMDGDGHRANRPTPTPSQLRLIHKAEKGNRFEERNSLAYDMATETSARSSETLQITVGQLPTREQLDRVYAGELTWSITVTRKGNRKGKLYPTADLLRRALDFCDNERMDVVNWCRERGKPVSDRLFVGAMGKALTTSALCGIARLAFQVAGVRGSYHRLRAVRARREVERALNAVETGDVEVGPASLWKHSILMHAADILDHRSLASLEHYLNDLINSRIQTSAAYKLDVVDAAIREKELISAAFDRRIEKQRDIHAIHAVVLEFSTFKTLKNPLADDVKKLFDFETEIRNFRLAYGEMVA